ncbi:hypothetical protein BZ163_16475 [Pseudomonas sp. VI4.1]|nr:hypothetical protein BZ163_16475 [Pseudomonas sp. VI4.1]
MVPESLDDYVSDTNPVRVVDVFADELSWRYFVTGVQTPRLVMTSRCSIKQIKHPRKAHV